MRNHLKVRDYPAAKYTPFLVVVPKLLTGTKRQRKFFATREQAEIYILRILNPEIGYAKADVRGQVTESGKRGGPLAECAQRYLEQFIQKKPTFLQLRRCLKPLISRHGTDPIDMVGVAELNALLRSLEGKYSPTTQDNYWRRIRQFFNHCHDFGWITSNPMKILKESHRTRRERPVLKPAAMRRCLEAAEGDRELMAYLCLGGFCGVRPGEILEMNWEDILWEHDEVRVPKAKDVNGAAPKDVWFGEYGKHKEISGDRTVTIEKNREGYSAFRHHLEPLALKGKQIDKAEQRRPDGGRGSRKIIPGGWRKLHEIRKPLRELLRIKEWPQDILRHSYNTFHKAYWRDLGRTSFEMGHGHNSNMTQRYGTTALKPDAEEWWAL